jgi:LPS sulfotransferase NodH
VLRRAGIEPVNSQRFFAGVERDAADVGRHCHCATHPAIRQVQRRAVLNPSVNFTRKRTVPQWHAASNSPVSFACMVKLPIRHSPDY